MNQPNPLRQNIRESAGIRLAVLFGLFFFLMLFCSISGQLITKMPLGDERSHILLTATLQCVLVFCLPAIILARFCSHNWKGWLELTRLPRLSGIIGVLIVYALSLPAMEWLIAWNSNIHLPEAFSGVEQVMREWENNAESTTKILLEATGFWSILSGILVIGILTGFSEELFFRGGFQGILTRTPMNKNLGVWLSAFLFSVMHFQFFGFLPRLLMGAFFGYLLLWSRSIWLPVLAHVLNNSLVVITSAITGEASESVWRDWEISDIVGGFYGVAGSIILTGLFFWLCRDMFKSNKTSHRWQRNLLPPVTGK